MPKATILVVDDEALIRWSLTERLKADGYHVVEADTGRAALEKLQEGVDLVLLDYRLPDTDGVSVLRKIKEFDQDILVILLTAYASVDTAVEAMKLGAYHFANKPFNLDDVAATVERALETTRLRREVRQYRTDAAKPYSLQRIVGASAEITALRHLIARVATSPASTVLLTGESGTGKDLVAKVIHYASDRAAKPFMNITCSALPEQLLESELFGHERGAFTGAVTPREGLFASADKGTIFLDEVGELPQSTQATLLRVLETGELRKVGSDEVRAIDVRVVAATNADLEELVERGRFRRDLFFRLEGVMVRVPPLREREDDIRALFRFFFAEASAAAKKKLTVTPDVEPLLCAYAWPGNVRELRNEVVRAVTMAADGAVLGRESFLPKLRRKSPAAVRHAREQEDVATEERQRIIQALKAHAGNKADAARSLGGMKRTTLLYKMERLKIRPEEYQVNES